MTNSQTYRTRVMTARDHRLVDALEADPRYRRVAMMLRPPVAKPKPAKAPEKAETRAAAEVPKPTPKAAPDPAPAPGHAVEGMTTKDAPGLGGKGR